jgi:hypothetical protein
LKWGITGALPAIIFLSQKSAGIIIDIDQPFFLDKYPVLSIEIDD